MADTDVKQRGRRWIATASPIEINDALQSGALDDLLSGRPVDDDEQPEPKPDQITRQQLAGMSPEAIVQAHAEGRLADTLTGQED